MTVRPLISDLVHETATTTGTGDFTIASVSGKQSFNSAFGTGGSSLFYYFISNRSAAEWEVGTGHLSSSTVLVRDAVINSSNADAAVNFSAGTKDVTNDIPAQYTQQWLDSGSVSAAATLDVALDTWSANFNVFKLYLWNIDTSADCNIRLTFSDDGGVAFEADAADYGWVVNGCAVTGTAEDAFKVFGDDSDAFINCSYDLFDAATTNAGSMEITIYDPAATVGTHVQWIIGYWDDEATKSWNWDAGSGMALTASAYTDVRVQLSTGTFSCEYTLVGLR
jgi:hypothetical protein